MAARNQRSDNPIGEKIGQLGPQRSHLPTKKPPFAAAFYVCVQAEN
ncbi:MAG: hypothetical protein ACJAZW_002311 [Maritalea sp.]|jgi:hypothetical protein